MALSPAHFDQLERAVVDRRRVALRVRGGEMIVVPVRVGLKRGRETIDALHPSTGEPLEIAVDDIEAFVLVANR